MPSSIFGRNIVMLNKMNLENTQTPRRPEDELNFRHIGDITYIIHRKNDINQFTLVQILDKDLESYQKQFLDNSNCKLIFKKHIKAPTGKLRHEPNCSCIICSGITINESTIDLTPQVARKFYHPYKCIRCYVNQYKQKIIVLLQATLNPTPTMIEWKYETPVVIIEEQELITAHSSEEPHNKEVRDNKFKETTPYVPWHPQNDKTNEMIAQRREKALKTLNHEPEYIGKALPKQVTYRAEQKAFNRQQYFKRTQQRTLDQEVLESATGAQPKYTAVAKSRTYEGDRLLKKTNAERNTTIKHKFRILMDSVSPALKPTSNTQPFPIEERLDLFNKREKHRCVHNNRYTGFVLYKKDNKTLFFEPACDCSVIIVKDTFQQRRCICGSLVNETQNWSQCKCEVGMCRRCTRKYYNDVGRTSNHCQCRPMPEIIDGKMPAWTHYDFRNRHKFQTQKAVLFEADANIVKVNFSYADAVKPVIISLSDEEEEDEEYTVNDLADWFNNSVKVKPDLMPLAHSREGNEMRTLKKNVEDEDDFDYAAAGKIRSCRLTKINNINYTAVKNIATTYGDWPNKGNWKEKAAYVATAPTSLPNVLYLKIKSWLGSIKSKLFEKVSNYFESKFTDAFKSKHPRIHKMFEYLSHIADFIGFLYDTPIHKFINIGIVLHKMIKCRTLSEVIKNLSLLYGALIDTPAYTYLAYILGMSHSVVQTISQLPEAVIEVMVNTNAYIEGSSIKVLVHLLNNKAHSLGEVFSGFLTDIASFFKFDSKQSARFMTAMATKSKDFNAIYTTSKNILTLATGVLGFMPKCIKGYFITTEPEQYLRKQYKDKNSNFVQLVKATAEYNDALYMTTDQFSLTEKRDKALAFYALVMKEVSDIGMTDQVMKILTHILKLIRQPAVIDKSRKEPMIITLTGPPSCGKTTLAKIIASVLTGEFTEEELVKMIYYRTSEDPYWSAYNPEIHKVIIYDDFGQDTESNADMKELIRLLSAANFAPEMPTVDDTVVGKKGTRIIAPYVILCTNMTNVKGVKGIYSTEALARRFGNVFRLEFKEEVNQTTTTEYTKVGKHIVGKMSKAPKVNIDQLNTVDEIERKDDFSHLNIYYEHANTSEKVFYMNMLDMIAELKMQHLIKTNKLTMTISNTLETLKKRYTKVNASTFSLETSKKVTTEETYADVATTSIKANSNEWTKKTVCGGEVLTMLGIVGLFVSIWFDVGTKFWLQCLIFFTSIVILLTSIIGIYNFFSEHQSHSRSYQSTLKPLKMVAHSWRDFEFTDEAEAHSGELTIGHKIRNNLVTITAHKDGKVRGTTGLFIAGTVVLCHVHFFGYEEHLISNGTELLFKQQGVLTALPIEFRRANMAIIPNTDMCLYNVGFKNMQPKQDITKYINAEPILEAQEVTLPFIRGQEMSYHTTNITRVLETLRYNSRGKEIFIQNALSYSSIGREGDCGVPVINARTNKILGFHCAGGSFMNYAVIISKAAIETAMKQFGDVRTLEESPYSLDDPTAHMKELNFINNEGKLIELTTQFTQFLGTTKPLITATNKSSIKLSPYAGCLAPIEFLPADLQSKFLLIGVNKYSNNCKQFKQADLEQVKQDLVQLYTSYKSPVPWRKLTVDEAVNGIPGTYVRPLDFTTSAAAPFNIMNITGEKRKLFDEQPNARMTPKPLLAKMLQQFENKIIHKIIPFVPFTDTLKDETRDLEKIQKPRMFSQGSLLYTIVCTQYFGSFTAHMASGRIYNEQAIGLNPYSLEYDLLIRYLLEVGPAHEPHFENTDVEKWDGSMILSTMWLFNEVVNDVYKHFNPKEDHSEIRDTLCCYESFALHMTTFKINDSHFTIFWLSYGGMPTGGKLTIYRNGGVNQIYDRVTWINLAPTHLKSLVHFRKHTRSQKCGDDNLVNKSKLAMSFMGIDAKAKFLGSYGIKIVNANDKNLPPEDVPLSESSFIKLKPRLVGGKYVPLLEYKTICNIINWYKNSIGYNAAFEMNSETILRFMYFYGKPDFTKVRDKLMNTKSVPMLTYADLAREYEDTGYLTTLYKDEYMPDDAELKSTVFSRVKATLNATKEEMNSDLIIAHSIISDTIREIEESIEPILKIGSKILNLDKPALSDNIQPLYLRDGQFHTFSRGTEWNIHNLGPLDPATQQLTDDEHTGTSINECTVKFLTRKPCLIAQVNWAASAVEGTTLFTTLVTPTADMDVAMHANTPQLFSTLSNISNKFVFWRGGIDLIFDFVCSNWQEGRVDFVYQPNQTIVSTDYKTKLSQYAISYTIRNGTNNVRITLPYIGVQPWRRIWRGDQVEDDPTEDVFKASDFISGVFSMNVSVPLKAPNIVVSNMDINIFTCASDDFELSMVASGGISRPEVLYSSSLDKRQLKAHSAEVDVDDTIVEEDEAPEITENAKIVPTVTKTQRAKAKLGKSGLNKMMSPKTFVVNPSGKQDSATLAPTDIKTGDPRNPHFGETYDNLLDVCKRYVPLNRLVITPSTVGGDIASGKLPYIIAFPYGSTTTHDDFINSHFGMASNLAAYFRNWRGSINYKVRVTQRCVAAAKIPLEIAINNNQVPYLTPATSIPDASMLYGRYVNSTGAITAPYNVGASESFTYGREGQWIEFKLPFLCPHSSKLLTQTDNFRVYSSNFVGLPQFSIWLTSIWSLMTTGDVVIDVYAALGDETRMFNFYMLPYTDQLVDTNGNALYPDVWPIATRAKQRNKSDFEIINAHSSDSQSDISNNQLNLRSIGGIGLLEQNKPEVVSATSSTVYNARAHAENPDLIFNLPQMLARQNFVGSVTWPTSAAVNTLLPLNGNMVTDVITDLLQSDIMSMPFERFAFWRCKNVLLQVQMTASRYHQGRVLIAYVPSQAGKATLSETITASRLIPCEHLMLDPANGTVATLRIPYRHFKGHLDLLNKDVLGQIYIVVMNQLQVATGGSPNVTAKIFASIEGSEFTTPRPGGLSFARRTAPQ
jgi:hypothetical protein